MKYSSFNNFKSFDLSDFQDMFFDFFLSWLIRFGMEICILIFVFVFILCGVWEIVKMLYFKIKFRYYRYCGFAKNGGLIHHIMILNSENDNKTVEADIVRPLELLGKNVCFPGRDFAEQGNMPELMLYQYASEKCSTFILVLTKSLVNSPREWMMLFEYVLAARKKELEIEDSDVLFIDYDDVLIQNNDNNNIRRQLKHTFPNTKVIDFKRKSVDEQRNELSNVSKDK